MVNSMVERREMFGICDLSVDMVVAYILFWASCYFFLVQMWASHRIKLISMGVQPATF